MPVPPDLAPFWSAFTQATGRPGDTPLYEAFAFGDSDAMADELAALVLRGTKRATAASRWSYDAEGQPLPKPGDLSIVTGSAGQPLCVIETRSVDVRPFDQVDAAFAATEGEGDGTLADWRRGHRAFFTRECAAAGRTFAEAMPVVCECFEVVYRP